MFNYDLSSGSRKKHFYRPENPSKLPLFFFLSLFQTIMDKSLGTLLHFWVFSNSHRVQPLPSHHKQRWMYVSRIFFRVSTLYRVGGRDNCKKISKTLHCHASLGTESKLCCCRHFFVKISRLHIMHISALRWTEFHQNRKDPFKGKKLQISKIMLFFVRRTLKRWQTSTNS